jgi:hypothetical protein
MTDSAINASPGESLPPDSTTPKNIMDRLELYKEENPTAVDYWIETELEAANLLIAMAACLDVLMADPDYDKFGVEDLKTFSRTYKATVRQGKAIAYLRELADADSIAVHGMRIRARRIVLQ